MDDKIQREKDFHNQRFSRPSTRNSKVGRFYKLNYKIREQYRQFLFQKCEGMHVLELGCGQNSYASDLARAGAIVAGIDISQVALKKVEAERETNNLTFQLMNAENLGFRDNSFDLVYGSGILHHLQLDRAMREIARVLRPEGKVAFIEPLGHNMLINAFRYLTPRIRSNDEHPLLLADLAVLERYFRKTDLQYFYLVTLAAAPFIHWPGIGYFLVKTLDVVDQWLFKIPFIRHQAWQVLIIASKPVK